MERLGGWQALELLRQYRKLKDVEVIGSLSLPELDDGDIVPPLGFKHCTIETIEGTGVIFQGHVSFEDCAIGSVLFYSATFLQGAYFKNCIFDGPAITFECGGHNQSPSRFILEQCVFRHFVNFFDCWYPGGIEVRQCHFEKGTNLIGNLGQPYQVDLGKNAIIENNIGAMNVNGG
ncbi:pentapeptide repeat-containing protein [Deinococcus sp. KNUC1210]|uniref:pentapeptide repeat-containing protein n=1 Tax=Deinococcus sp. KNUC1210 TaxID=2917691 RepID=UPI001EF06C98|nr:pentapeptide repeat-containing protein [Deinococcus sp. KNUC1210]ULH15530.1 pentapeptide repeat-containing protein [Deinococcus sp. KNUC1210]